MQQGQTNNQQQNDVAETEDDGIDVGSSKQGKFTFIVLMIIFVSAVIYFIFLREPKEAVNNAPSNEIVIGGGGVQPVRTNNVDYNATDLLDVVPTTDDSLFNAPKTEDSVPALPELPKLSDEIKQQISSGVSVKKEDTYTKDEVDKMIEDKMKQMLENQMQNKVVVTAAETKKEKATTENNQQKLEDGLYNIEDQTTKTDVKTTKKNDAIITQPTSIKSEMTQDELLAQQQKKEAEDLEKIKKSRALQERKIAPMFKMSGGSGPSSSLSTESDSIILSFSDNKIDIQNKTPDVVPTQISDLTRVILQGKIINAVLETAIDTNISTTVRAVITRDVFAEEGKGILIPKGSRVIGSYETAVAAGQTRVTINWNRIIRVDGMSLNIASIGADRLGRAGVEGDRDDRYAQRLANTFLSSVLSVGTAILSEKVSGSTGISTTLSSLTGDTSTTSGKASDYAIVDATKNFMDEAQTIVDNIAEQKAVIRIPQGEKVVIMVTQDITLPIFKKGN